MQAKTDKKMSPAPTSAMSGLPPEWQKTLVSGAQRFVGPDSSGAGDTPYRREMLAGLRVAEQPFLSED